MSRRIVAVFMLTVMCFCLCFGSSAASVTAVGSGTREDPYVCSNSDTIYVAQTVTFPFYVYAKGSRGNIYCPNVVFESGKTYYVYFPNVDSHSTRLYTYSSATNPGNIVLQTFTLEYESENWLVYSFVASQDGYGCQTRYSGTKSTFYYDTVLHEPVEFGKAAVQLLGGFLDVGSQFVSWVVATPVLLIGFTAMVLVFGISMIRKIYS